METKAESSTNTTDNSSAESRSDIHEVASALQVMFSDLREGEREADLGMEKVLPCAAEEHLVSPQRILGFRVADKQREGGLLSAVIREQQHQQRCGDSGSEIVPWSSLPRELIPNIIARLPLPSLINLRQFSLNPNCNISLDDGEFRRLCAQIHTKIVGLMVPIKGSGSLDRRIQGFYSVGVHGMESSTWQIIKLSVAREYDLLDSTFYAPLTSCNGGLVSFAQPVFTKSDGICHLIILVVNPLTGECKELPEPSMVLIKTMQLVMDRDTKRYRLIVVGRPSCCRNGVEMSLGAECFDSRTGVWTLMEKSPDVVVGLQYSRIPIGSLGGREDHSVTSYGTYDCAKGALVEFGSIQHWPRGGRRGPRCNEPYVFVEDHLFMLHAHQDLGICSIGEYHLPNDGSRYSWWMKLKEHRFDPYSSDRRPEKLNDVKFWGCKGFLLVVENVQFKQFPQPQEVAWLYDLSTGVWSDFPELRDGRKNLSSTTSIMCELQWDSIP